MRKQELASHEGEDENEQEQNKEDREKDLGKPARQRRYVAEAERAGHERNNQKNDRPFEHGNVPLRRQAFRRPFPNRVTGARFPTLG